MSKKQQQPISEGRRTRLGRRVRDAITAINMHLTPVDIREAKKRRRTYDLDEPENFTACALAQCLGKMSGAEVLVMRRYAFIALPGEKYTLRYQLDTTTADIVKANDLDQLDTIAANAPICFRPPTPGRRLVAQGGPRVSKKSRGILANPPKPATPDPYQGVYRNGVHAS